MESGGCGNGNDLVIRLASCVLGGFSFAGGGESVKILLGLSWRR